jgi:hypothetical protein
MDETFQIKFKSSVAPALHPRVPKGPKLEQVNVAVDALMPQASAICR